jgi:diacylglycerol kinase (ATP)
LNIWLAIINPSAGNKNGLLKWEKIKEVLKSQQIPFVPLIIYEPNTTIEKTKEAIEKGFRRLLVVGGDGTLNETVNAIFESGVPSKDFIVGMIPIGTGNDWCRMYNIYSKNIDRNIKIIKNEKTTQQDVGIVEYFIGSEKKKRYFVNNAGMGYDPLVVDMANRQKKHGIGNRFSYFLNIFSLLHSYKSSQIKVKVDDEEFTADMFSMNVGICKYMGAGMMLLPYAIPDDGLLEFTLIRNIGAWKILCNMPKLYNGNIVKLHETVITQGEKIDIQTEKQINLEVDGEVLGHSPFKFRILNKALFIAIP